MEKRNSCMEGLVDRREEDNSKLLSIYIPTYNREKYISQQLKFLINELKDMKEELIEIVVNDNCSTDNTKEVVEQIIKGTKIIYHRNERNLGIVHNLYEAANYTSGKYLWTISDDDILCEGIVKRVVSILENDVEMGYVFLNYAPIEGGEIIPAYGGKGGKIEDGASHILSERIKELPAVILMSASIYTRAAFIKSIQVLPLGSEEAYGISGYASLASMKYGKSYFEKKVWVYSNPANKSWNDIVYESNMGMLRMFRKLCEVGYTKADVSKIYHMWISQALVAGRILHRMTITGDIKRYLKDTGYCMRYAPDNVVRIYASLTYRKIRGWIFANRAWK